MQSIIKQNSLKCWLEYDAASFFATSINHVIHFVLEIFNYFFQQTKFQLNNNYTDEFPDEFNQHPNHVKVPKCKNKVTNVSNNTLAEQRQTGPFMQWIQTILGIKPTTTTEKPTIEEKECPPCNKCGVPNNGTKIVGNEN